MKKIKIVIGLIALLANSMTGCKKTIAITATHVEYSGVAYLSVVRGDMSAASAGHKALFAGGHANNLPSDVVDIYDADDHSWTTAKLSIARQEMGAGAAGNKIAIAGGQSATDFSDQVDIYDVSTNRWTTATLSEPRALIATASIGSKIFYGGGVNSKGGIPIS